MELLETEHIAAVAATVVLGALAVLAARLWPERRAAALCRGLALVILVAYATDHTVAIARGDWSARRYLPLHLTDAVTIVSAVALLTARALPVEVTYFWALTASLQAVLTPDLGEGFPDPYFWTYFVTHSGAVVAACVLVFGRGLCPRPGAAWRAFAATAAMAALAAAGNRITGGNYMFLREKPDNSLLDLMGPWPWYIAVAAAFGLALFALLHALARSTPAGRR